MNLFLGTIHKEVRVIPDGNGGHDTRDERVSGDIDEIEPKKPHDAPDASTTYVTADGRVALWLGFYEASLTITFPCGVEIATDSYAGIAGGSNTSSDVYYAAATREEVQAWLDRSP
ncbi:hypothetical protein KBA73_04850 [Patescibacteria group bacterium]|nr:hypothetical protein [Patescibacteria group bacterium]